MASRKIKVCEKWLYVIETKYIYLRWANKKLTRNKAVENYAFL